MKLAKILRVSTTAPILALVLCSLIYALLPGGFADLTHYLFAVLFLCVLPLLAYPVAAMIPALRKKGRPLQRNLAIVFSVIGYVAGMVYALLSNASAFEPVLYGTYLISGILIMVFTLCHFKASGHACGVAGPIVMLCCYLGPIWALCVGLLLLVYWASLKMRRHTLPQLIVGSVIPAVAMLLSIVMFSGTLLP